MTGASLAFGLVAVWKDTILRRVYRFNFENLFHNAQELLVFLKMRFLVTEGEVAC